MSLTPQYLTDLVTQLDILNDYQCEEEQQLRLTLSALQQPTAIQLHSQRQRTLLALNNIQEDRAVTHDLRRRLTTGLTCPSLLADDFHDATHPTSTPSTEDTPLF